MSSTERAPEPTMEEILASIRRIISDDEANAAQQRATTADYPEQIRAEDADDEAADTQIIDDIARVLSGSAPAANDDEILDLAEMSVASEVTIEPVDAAAPEDELILSEEVVTEIYAVPSFAAAFPAAEQGPAEAPQSLSEPPPYAEAPVSEPAQFTQAPQSEPGFLSGVNAASEDPTTALERAIAALKAGDLSAFAREAQSDFAVADTAPATPFGEPFATPPSPEPEAMKMAEEEEPLALDEPVALGEPAVEESAPAWSAETSSWPRSESLPEPEAAPAPWRSEELSWPKSTSLPPLQPSPARTNGGSAHKAHDFEAVASKSLEDSVKEMLRPLLRQWLDENMPRVLTAALRDELENSEMGHRGS